MTPPSTPDPRRKFVVFGVIAALAIAAGIALWKWPFGDSEPPRRPRPRPTETEPEFATIPKIDVHTHVAPMLADEAIRLLWAEGIEVAINAFGGVLEGGAELSAQIAERSGRLLFYCNFSFSRVEDPDFAMFVDETFQACKWLGAVGLKISKSFGLGITLADDSILTI